MELTINANAYNTYIRNCIITINRKRFLYIMKHLLYDDKIKNKLKLMDNLFRKNTKFDMDKFLCKDHIILCLFIKVYADERIRYKDETFEYEIAYYEYLHNQVEKGNITENYYIDVGDTIKATNNITAFFDKDYNAFGASVNDDLLKIKLD
jgi:hypothetical protein